MWKIIRTMLTPAAIDQCSHYILILLADISLPVHHASLPYLARMSKDLCWSALHSILRLSKLA